MQIVQLIISNGNSSDNKVCIYLQGFLSKPLITVFLCSVVHTSSGALWNLDILQTGVVGNEDSFLWLVINVKYMFTSKIMGSN